MYLDLALRYLRPLAAGRASASELLDHYVEGEPLYPHLLLAGGGTPARAAPAPPAVSSTARPDAAAPEPS
jgi:hypothetical protein